MILAPRAIPLVITCEGLLLSEPVEAILDSNRLAPSLRDGALRTAARAQIHLIEIWLIQHGKIGPSILVPQHDQFKVTIILHGFKNLLQGYLCVVFESMIK